MRLDVYVNYRGVCEEAFHFYQKHLGGEIAGFVRHGDVPNPNIPPDWKSKVLHAQMNLGATVLMGADIPSAEPMRSAYLSINVDSNEEAERIYQALGDGGRVLMKMEETFFAFRFGQVQDKFGMNWMILHERPQ